MAKSISSALRQLLQKNGDKLAAREIGREEFVKLVNQNADMARASVGRHWGDRMKDTKDGFAYKK